MNDASNLARDGRPLDRDSRQHLFNLGNLLWHSDSSFRPIPAKYSLLSARVVNPVGGNTEFADMRAAYDALDADTKAKIEDLICEHSLMYSRGSLGMVDFTDGERAMFPPRPRSRRRSRRAHHRATTRRGSHRSLRCALTSPSRAKSLTSTTPAANPQCVPCGGGDTVVGLRAA